MAIYKRLFHPISEGGFYPTEQSQRTEEFSLAYHRRHSITERSAKSRVTFIIWCFCALVAVGLSKKNPKHTQDIYVSS